jgi:uncharacterized membrane protein
MRPKSSSRLKQDARGLLLGKYRTAIAVLLASDLILTALTLVVNISFGGYRLIYALMQFCFFVIVLAFVGILAVGQSAFYLNIACNQPYQLTDLFTGFRLHPDKAVGIRLLTSLLSLLPMVPAVAAAVFSYFYFSASLFLVFCLLLIIGSFLSWRVALAYSQCTYLLLDFPECGVFELMAMSRRMMKKNMGRLFYLQVSFIPMSLLGMISFGLGLLFIRPYQSMTYTLFYLDLIQSRAEQTTC